MLPAAAVNRTLIAIPARLAATRLPNKPLADINGLPMIVQVWQRAMAARAGRVIVATDSMEIAQAIGKAGGEAVMTSVDHVNGTTRIYEAVGRIDPDRQFEWIVNMQGDLPTIDPKLVDACLAPLADDRVDIATLACEIVRDEEKTSPSVVKAVGTPLSATRMRALYFTRVTAPYGEGPLYHHIGMYAYRRKALTRFVGLAPAPLEQREKLEQLRALENGMRIDVELVATVPLGVDTPEDLERARAMLRGR